MCQSQFKPALVKLLTVGGFYFKCCACTVSEFTPSSLRFICKWFNISICDAVIKIKVISPGKSNTEKDFACSIFCYDKWTYKSLIAFYDLWESRFILRGDKRLRQQPSFTIAKAHTENFLTETVKHYKQKHILIWLAIIS